MTMDLTPGVRAILYYAAIMLLMLGILLLLTDDAAAAEGPVVTDATPEANDASSWGAGCFKVEPIPEDTFSYVATDRFSTVVLKAATLNWAWTNVEPGDVLTVGTNSISHIIKCEAEEEPSPTPTTPTPTVTSTPSPTPTPSPMGTVTPTPTPSPASTPTASPSPTTTVTPSPSATPTVSVTPTPTPSPPTTSRPTPTPTGRVQCAGSSGCLADTGPGDTGLLLVVALGFFSAGGLAFLLRRLV